MVSIIIKVFKYSWLGRRDIFSDYMKKLESKKLASSSTTINCFSTENTFSSLWLEKVNCILSPCFLVIKIHQREKNDELGKQGL